MFFIIPVLFHIAGYLEYSGIPATGDLLVQVFEKNQKIYEETFNSAVKDGEFNLQIDAENIKANKLYELDLSINGHNLKFNGKDRMPFVISAHTPHGENGELQYALNGEFHSNPNLIWNNGLHVSKIISQDIDSNKIKANTIKSTKLETNFLQCVSQETRNITSKNITSNYQETDKAKIKELEAEKGNFSHIFSQSVHSLELHTTSIQAEKGDFLSLSIGELDANKIKLAGRSLGEIINNISIPQKTENSLQITPNNVLSGISKNGKVFEFDENGNLWIKGTLNADGGCGCLSDIREKENIHEIKEFQDILKITPISFNFKNHKEKRFGFIAQEVEKYFPNLVRNINGKKMILYMDFIPLLLAYVKELEEKNKKYEERISNIEKELESLKKKINEGKK